MSKERKLKRFRMSTQCLIALGQQVVPSLGRAFEVVQMGGLPSGTEVHHVGYDLYSNNLIFFVEHPSFEPVAEGMEVPEIYPTFTSTLVKKVEEPI